MALRHVITWHGWLVGAEANVCPLDSVVVKGNDSDPLFQSDTGAAEPNTEAQKRSMNRVVKETPALITGLKGGQHCGRMETVAPSGGSVFTWASQGPMTGLERRGIRLSLPVWIWPRRQIKVPNVLYQRRKPRRTGWVWRKPEK